MYSGLSLAYSEVGQLNQSAYYAQRALAIHETLNDRLSLARSETNLGILLIKRGELAAAGEHLNRGLALFDETAVVLGKAEALLGLCELAFTRSQLAEAKKLAIDARDLSERLSEKATLAECHMWLGRIADERDEHENVDSEFRTAVAILEALGASERLSRCYVQHAELLEKRGDLVAANQQLRLALGRLPNSVRKHRTATA
jgi:tetratricopeptide (TPR) repeat protein